jgi:integration host factor subunit beta
MTDKLNRFTSGKLVDEMAARNSDTKTDGMGHKARLNMVMNETVDAIAAMLSRGEKVEIRGFGTFKITHRAARQARNPRDGSAISIAAKDVITFKPAKNPA